MTTILKTDNAFVFENYCYRCHNYFKSSQVEDFCVTCLNINTVQNKRIEDMTKWKKIISKSVIRECLKCDRPFAAKTKFHRRCDQCKSNIT